MRARSRSSVPNRLNHRHQEHGDNTAGKSIVIKIHSSVDDSHIQRHRCVQESGQHTHYHAELTGDRRQSR